MNRIAFCLAFAAASTLGACAPHAPSPAVSQAAVSGALPTPLVLPSDAPPQILAVQLSDPVFHSGETITGTVVTSTNVSSVQLHFEGRAAQIPQSSPGIFAISYQLPHIPFFLDGTYTAQIVASNALGVSAQRPVTVSIR